MENQIGAGQAASGRLSYGLKRCRYGLTLYNTNDVYVGQAFHQYGEYNEAEMVALRQLCGRGDHVFDIGANMGAHTVPMAQHVGPQGRVYAIEPQRIVYQMMCANVALSAMTNVHTFRAAAGSAPGSINVPSLDYSQRGNYGGVSVGGDRGEPVPVITVDSLQPEKCRLIKIDVEGFELDVLQGAARTIARFQPRLYLENDRREKSPALIAHLQSLGYRLYWHLPPLFSPENFFKNPKNVWGHIVSINMLCLGPDDRTPVAGLREVTGPDDDWRQR
ncbi:MAG: FkbM family methyltransferase [Reyranellaceae bacterium]